jgi:phosphonate transport system substrate-binding protein
VAKANPRTTLRFELPSSLGPAAQAHFGQLQSHLTQALGRDTEVVAATDYEHLAKDLISGRVDAAWAPPFVCARIEAMRVRVLVRGVRAGASMYRAALVTRIDSPVSLQTLSSARAAWSDRDSVGGFLLPMAWMREQGLDPTHAFASQVFVGSYRAALEAVLDGAADVTSVFAPVARPGIDDVTGLSDLWPEKTSEFRALGFTDEAPNDGVAVSMSLAPAIVADLERTLLTLQHSASGAAILKECFHADRFELAPRSGYRALYRVALASL